MAVRLGFSRFLVLLSLAATAMAACNFTAAQSCVSKPSLNLLFYCHVPLSNASAAQLQSDSAPLLGSSNPAAMGAGRVFDYKCTPTPDPSTPPYCRARGASFVDSRNGSQIMVSTIAMAAAPGTNSTNSTTTIRPRGSMSVAGEILGGGSYSTSAAVVGGVGDFLAAAGEINISTYNVSGSGTDMVLKFMARVVFPLYTV